MLKKLTGFAALSIALTATLATGPAVMAQDEQPAKAALSPNQIVASAEPYEWMAIPADNLLVMTLAPDARGNARTVVIQLMPAPFSQGWVENIRTLARANWYDGVSVNRVQDNYVVQWGDADGEDEARAKPLPEGLNTMTESDYVSYYEGNLFRTMWIGKGQTVRVERPHPPAMPIPGRKPTPTPKYEYHADAYSDVVSYAGGFPVAVTTYFALPPQPHQVSPIHCYGMVGVGRNYSPDTGSGAELYTVIGHAPRHLDRNIALVGRIIEGMEHLSSLPRGSGELGFYTEEEVGKRTPIQSVRVVSDMPETERPQFEYLNTEGSTFARYADARANRRDPFFITPAGGADICNIPVPIRRVSDVNSE